jgi:hypothetical protein
VNGNIGGAYSWQVTNSMHWRVGPEEGYNRNKINQAVSIRGYKIAVREGSFASLLGLGSQVKVSSRLPRTKFNASSRMFKFLSRVTSFRSGNQGSGELPLQSSQRPLGPNRTDAFASISPNPEPLPVPELQSSQRPLGSHWTDDLRSVSSSLEPIPVPELQSSQRPLGSHWTDGLRSTSSSLEPIPVRKLQSSQRPLPHWTDGSSSTPSSFEPIPVRKLQSSQRPLPYWTDGSSSAPSSLEPLSVSKPQSLQRPLPHWTDKLHSPPPGLDELQLQSSQRPLKPHWTDGPSSASSSLEPFSVSKLRSSRRLRPHRTDGLHPISWGLDESQLQSSQRPHWTDAFASNLEPLRMPEFKPFPMPESGFLPMLKFEPLSISFEDFPIFESPSKLLTRNF